jgi:hypothetical protein
MITPFKHPLTKDTPTREDFFNLVDVTSDDMNETLNQIMKSRSIDHSWKCFDGPIHVYATNRSTDNLFVGASTKTMFVPNYEGSRLYNGSEFEMILETAVINVISVKAIRWINPLYKDVFVEECREKNIDINQAFGTLTYDTFDRFNSFKEAALLLMR